MWADLIAALNSTGYDFVHFAWAKDATERRRDHGVYAEDSENAMFANNKRSEHLLQGTVDYYTRDDSGTPKARIEEALESYDILYWLESIQFEDDTGYIHYEWVFEVTR